MRSIPRRTTRRRLARGHKIPLRSILCPREESNLHLLLRTELFYPLNYKGGNRLRVAYFYDLHKSVIVVCMTPEERSLLERTAALAAENNLILRSIRRSNRISTVLRIFYWVVIIGLSFGAFYLIQPWVEQMISVLDKASSIQSSVETTQGATSQLQGILQRFQASK